MNEFLVCRDKGKLILSLCDPGTGKEVGGGSSWARSRGKSAGHRGRGDRSTCETECGHPLKSPNIRESVLRFDKIMRFLKMKLYSSRLCNFSTTPCATKYLNFNKTSMHPYVGRGI